MRRIWPVLCLLCLAVTPDARAEEVALGGIIPCPSINHSPIHPTPTPISWPVTQRPNEALPEQPPSVAGNEIYQTGYHSLRTFNLVKPLARPLKIYIESYPSETDVFKPSYINLVKESLDEWSVALDGRLTYELTPDKKHADIEIYWVDKIGDQAEKVAGITSWQTGHAKIEICGQKYPDNLIQKNILHEVGHALGLQHSQDTNDIMYGQGYTMTYEEYHNHQFTLSDRDSAAIQRLYGPEHKAGEDEYLTISQKYPPFNIAQNNIVQLPKSNRKLLISNAPITPDFSVYLANVQKRIRTNWTPALVGKSYQTVVFFEIAKDGSLVKSPNIEKSSGFVAADQAALAAVYTTVPFDKLPDGYKKNSVGVRFTFGYETGVASNRKIEVIGTRPDPAPSQLVLLRAF